MHVDGTGLQNQVKVRHVLYYVGTQAEKQNPGRCGHELSLRSQTQEVPDMDSCIPFNLPEWFDQVCGCAVLSPKDCQ